MVQIFNAFIKVSSCFCFFTLICHVMTLIHLDKDMLELSMLVNLDSWWCHLVLDMEVKSPKEHEE